MYRPHLRSPVVTTLASAVAFALVSAPAYADIDRLQLINGAGQPSVSPGTELSKGVLFDNQLIFAGTNLQSTAQRELHGANLTDRAYTIDGLLGGGPDTRPVIGVTRIDEFGGSLVISHSGGVNILDPGALSSDPRTSGPINGQQSVQQAGNYYLNGNFTGGTGNDFVTLSDVNSSFQLIESDTQICNQSAAKAGSSTVVFLGADNNLQKVVAPSTTPQPLFAGGITPPFTSACTLASVDGKVVFHAFEAGTSSDQIYITDGTSSGTERLRGFNIEGNGTTFPHFQEFNGQLLFGATDTGDSEYGLWITDGSEAGTVELKNANAEISDVQPDRGFLFEGVLFFPIAQTLWQTDGTAAGTSQVLLDGAEINLEGEPSFTVFDEDFHFVATINGTPQILRMANPGDAPEVISGITQRPVAINGKLGDELLVAADNNLFTMAKEPVLSISSNTEVAENAGTGTVTVAMTLSETVPYEVSFSVETEDGDAIAGNDYIQVPKQTLTIPANTPQTTLTINLQNDLAQEETETFQVRISDLDGARLGNRTDTSNTGTVTITDSDAPVQAGTLQVLPAEVGEGSGNATVTVVTGGNSAVEITFDFTLVAGTATAGADFSAVSGSGSIAAGASSTTISIPVAEDTLDEPNESFSVIVTPTAGLSSGLNVALQPVNVTIIDNDDAPAEPVEPPASSGGGGGGCSITSGGSSTDPMLPGLMLLALGVLFARRRTSLLPESNRA